jgi:ACS family glucarate transporter-like MFS transporter
LLLLPLLIRAVGWRMAFLLTGALGFAWVAAWWWWYRDDPGENPRVSAAELHYIRGGLTGAAPDGAAVRRPGGLRALLTSRNTVLLMFQAFAGTFTFYISVTWLLPYLTQQWGQRAGIYASIPPLIGAVALWGSGAAVSALHGRGHIVASRRGPAILGKLVAAAGLLLATQTASLPVFVLLFAIALAGVEFVTAAAWTTCMDVGGEHTGTVSAAMNMSGNVGATLSAVLFPYFMTHVTIPVLAPRAGTANSYFVFAAVMNLLAACAWLFIDPLRKPRL